MVRYFRQVLLKVILQFGFQLGIGNSALLVLLAQFAQQLGTHVGKVGDEVERVLNFVGNAGRQLAQAGHLLALDQLGLGDFQLLQGGA